MHNKRRDSLLAGVAVAAALALTASGNAAFAQSSQTIVTASAAQGSASDTPAAAPAATQAETPAAAPAPAAAPEATGTVKFQTASADADTAVSEKLREMSAGKFDRILGSRKDRGSVEAFYSERNFAPLWITSSALNDRGKAAIAYLSTVEEHGLESSDYPTPEVRAGAEADALADAEIRLTQTLLTFARHAQIGRVHYTRTGIDIAYELDRPEPADVLARLAKVPNVKDALESFHPPHPAYKALKAKLAEARKPVSETGPQRIPGGLTLKYGKDKKGKEVLMEDPRVPALRERLGVAAADNKTYDKALADAVSAYQKTNKLPVTGQLGPQTLDAINGPRRDRDADVIIANMERWRWVPRELGNIHVMVNVPDYTLQIMRNEAIYWKTRIVAGKPSQATPVTSAEMKFITVNPTWNVPPSIIQNEYLPALAQDPQVLERMGLKIVQERDGTVRIWQPPGERNALGRIRFNFPNKFLVYQHDTPDKNLFAHDKRAYSHGCMRVQDPLLYGEKLLSLALPNEGYTQERLRKMFGGSEININFPKTIPVHLTYQTAFVDETGKLVIREDVYGRDARLLAVLKGSERRVADTAVDRPKPNFAAPVRVAPGTYGGPGGGGGPSFFDRLFGAPAAAPAPQPQQRQRAAQRTQPNQR